MPTHRGRGDRYRDLGYWRDELLTDIVRQHVARKPAATAVVDGATRTTWEDLWEAARRAASVLAREGVGHGDVVSTQLPNGRDIVVLHLATELLGAVHNPLAVQFREHELDQVASIMRPTIVVHPGTLDGHDYSSIHSRTAAGRSGRAISVDRFDATDPPDPGTPDVSAARASDGAFILNTSGTVSIKGVLHSHEDALFSTRTVAELIGLDGSDTVICAIPMTWGGGLAWGLRVSLHVGATLVSLPRWDPASAAEIIDAEGGSYIYGPPTLVRDLVGLAGQWRPRRALKAICAGAPIPRQLCHDARDKLGMTLFPGYGQTEHLHSTLGRKTDSEDELTSTDGSALPGVEVGVFGKSGEPCGPEEVGDILCRGPNVAREYYRQPELSAATFREDDWQVTQDLGSLDVDGYLRVAGRKRDIIIRGGLNVSPREVEELLLRHPDVKEVAVVGFADARYGERICAFVVPGGKAVPSVDELSAALSAMGVARYKHPERVEAIEALPLTVTGKVRHESLRVLLKDGQAQRPAGRRTPE